MRFRGFDEALRQNFDSRSFSYIAVLYVREPRFVATNGVSLRYEIVGDGPPLCLINGFRLSGATWPQAFVDCLAANFSVLTYDCRGTGVSEKPLDGYAIPTMARDAAEMIKKLGFERAHVFGFSMGGAVAQEVALRHPDRVNRLVLFATFAGAGFAVPAPWSVQRKLYEVEGLSPEDAARQVWPVTYSPSYLRDNLSTVEMQMLREIANPTPDYVARGQLSGIKAFSSGCRLWSIRSQTLVMTGDEDKLIPAFNSRIIAWMIPFARIKSQSGLGHRAIWEKPEEMALIVTNFLKAPEHLPTPLAMWGNL